MRRTVPVLLAVVLAAAVAACNDEGNRSGDVGRVVPSEPPRPELVAAADLDPCPPSSSETAADGGLPDLTLACLGDGPDVHLAGLRGPLVMNVWASWCGPCQEETPYFATAYRELKGEVTFLGVDDEDSPNSALDFAAHVRPRMRYPSVVDEDKAVLTALSGFSSVPSTLFLDAEGRIVKRQLGAYDSAAQLRADIARYLDVDG